MEKRLIILLMTVAATASSVKAQSDDFGIWTEANVEKKLSTRLSVDGGVEWRLRDNASETERWSAGVGVEYKLTDWLKASAGYNFLYDNVYKENNKGTKYAEFWRARQRFNVSLTASKSFGDLKVSLRERWQYTYRPEVTATRYYLNTTTSHDAGEEADEHTYRGKGKNVWRNRLNLEYKVSKIWRPYVAGESYVAGSGLEKMRLSLGTEIRLSKKHALDVGYTFQKVFDDDDDEGNKHILGLAYKFKF